MRRVLIATVLVAVVPLLRVPAPHPALARTGWAADTGRDSTKDTTKKTDSLPLVPTRTVAFDVSEATWLSLDLAPDGQTIVLDGNPLEDIHNTNTIRYVMKNGRLYEGETLNEVWPRQRSLPAMWWWGEEPTGTH